MVLNGKDILGIDSLSREKIHLVLETGVSFRSIAERPRKKIATLVGRTVANLFFEYSTRTRMSFELAAKRLSADFINIPASIASDSPGETISGEPLTDIAKTIEAMQVDFLVIRHPMAGAPQQIAKKVGCSVINAGDGRHSHPTQALADLFTILQLKGKLEGLKVAVLGDHILSPITKSAASALKLVGAEVTMIGPSTLIPPGFDTFGVEVSHSMEEGLKEADVVLVSRVEITRENELSIPSLREYARFFCLTEKRLAIAKPDVEVLHSGSMNRGIEISPEVADKAFPNIVRQVTDGLAIRMALLYLLSGKRKP
ncbi:MAG: aspartate carbamoyltransferase catalytic subunit [bacterium]|nr:aspartate carbamoyltransferase catalytic subunit [bacterium]